MLELVLMVLAILSLLSLSVVLNYFNNKKAELEEESMNVRINAEDCNYRSLVSCEM